MSSATFDSLQAALAEHRAGNLTAAEAVYKQIVAQAPGNAAAWDLLGMVCLQSGRTAEAVDCINRAIELDATSPDFFNHLGAAYGALGNHDAAVTSLRRAVRLNPQLAQSHYNLGTALRNQGRLEDAVTSFRHSIAVEPLTPEAHYNLANTLNELKRFEEAEASYREALRLRPLYVRALVNLGNLLRDRERLEEATLVLRTAIEADPQHANAHLNLGTLLRDMGRFEEAIEALRRALLLAPQSAEAHNNLGTALQAVAEFDAASACYERALTLDPNLADAHFSRATCLLREGDLAGGFAEYEWRWKCKSFNRPFPRPRWDGSSFEGRTLLLHAEQGLGDTLHFVRFAAAAKSRGGRVVVECQPPLVPLLTSCAGIDVLIENGKPLPPFDLHCPLMSLVGTLGLSLEELWTGPYLSAAPALIETWRQRLSQHGAPRIGICWQGNPKHLFDSQRSFALAALAPVAAAAGQPLVSLQKGNEAAIVASPFAVLELGTDFDTTAGAFMDTAAVMKNLDLVITADTAIAHLAGALGVRVWVALSANCDWRWFAGHDDSLWYPSMRLFRQTQLGDWSNVFERMAAELANLPTIGN